MRSDQKSRINELINEERQAAADYIERLKRFDRKLVGLQNEINDDQN